MKTKTTLKTKLRLMTLIPVVILSALFVVFFIMKESSTRLTDFNDEGKALANAYASSVQNTITSLSQQFDPITKNNAIVDKNTMMATRKTMLENEAAVSTFKDFSIAYSDGTTYNNTDISAREYFKQAMATKGAYVSSPVVRMTDNSVTIMMGKYFTNNGSEYVVYGGLEPDTFSNMIKVVHFEENGIAFIIDKEGIVVGTSTSLVPQLTNVTDSSTDSTLVSAASEMLAQQEGNARFTVSGQDYIAGYAKISGPEQWTVVVGTPSAPLTNSIFMSCISMAGMAVILIIAIIIITSRVIKGISVPITETSKRLTKMAEGDITSPAKIFETGDEIQTMTVAMGEMVGNISSYISDIKATLTSVAGGDLTRTPQVQYHGDFTEINNSMQLILDSLNNIMGDVSRSSLEVKKGASQLAEGSSGLSSGAISQAAAVDQVNTTVQSMSVKTQENEQIVKNALDIARNTDAQAHGGAKNMEEMLSAITEIEESSKQIGKIIKVIEDISFQTNILALNASVEAARAGAAGKGFSVVAGEVRNLAGKSADAAKQTNELITRSMTAVSKGTQLAGITSQALEGIVEGVDKVTSSIMEIAKFNEEQNSAVKQISSAMENVNQAIHNTTATAEESAAESEELSSLASGLSNAVSHFKINS